MSTKQQNKRVTKQIRISEHIHRLIKLEAVNKGETISKLVDKIIKNYLSANDR